MAQLHLLDLDTARKIGEGDVDATEKFLLQHYASLFRFMRHLTGQTEDAEDLTQQAFVQAKHQIASYRGSATLRTWLFKVAFHEYTHWKRTRRKSLRLHMVPAHVEPAFQACIEAEALLDSLRKLPESMLEAFLLHEVQELSVEETACVLRIPKGTVISTQ